jgi:chromosome segregation ATPase
MDEAVAAQARERVTRWIEESRELLGLLPGLLGAHGKSEHTDKEHERLRKDAELLRKEVADLRKEGVELKKESVDLKKSHADILVVVDELKKQNEILRGEKEEAAGAFAKLLDTMQSTNQIAQKLGMTKSPFARHPAPGAAPAPTAAPTPTPNTTPHE